MLSKDTSGMERIQLRYRQAGREIYPIPTLASNAVAIVHNILWHVYV